MTLPIDRIRPVSAPRRSVAELAGRFSMDLHPPTGEASESAQVWSVASDDRAVLEGDLFVALPGAHAHGASFARAAIERGAHAIMTDADGARLIGSSSVPVLVCPDPRAALGPVAAWVYESPAERLTTFAVTGTNGKTTTTYMIDHVLRALGWKSGLVGTVETRAGDKRLDSRLTTPEAADLQAVLATMVEQQVQTLVMEVSSHALSLHRVDGVVFDVAGFTNLSQDHLDFHQTLEGYFRAKASLFTAERARRAVVLVDDEWGRRLAREAAIPVATLSVTGAAPADWNVHVDSDGGRGQFELRHNDGRRLRTSTSLPGAFNLANAALAVAMVVEAGADTRDVEEALAAVGGVDPVVPGRMETIAPGTPGPRVVVDFAHNPVALAAAIAAVRPRNGGRLRVVFGATGERDRGKRPAMGATVVDGADVVIVTDDDPHDEDPGLIRSEVMAGAVQAQAAASRTARSVEILEVAPRAEAIRVAIAEAADADTVLIAGRGHEHWQEIAGVDHPLDDRAEARAALVARGSRPEMKEPNA